MRHLTLRQTAEREVSAVGSGTTATDTTLYTIPAGSYLYLRQAQLSVTGLAIAAAASATATLWLELSYTGDVGGAGVSIMQAAAQTPAVATMAGAVSNQVTLTDPVIVYGGPRGQDVEVTSTGTTNLVGWSAWLAGWVLDAVEVERERAQLEEFIELFQQLGGA